MLYALLQRSLDQTIDRKALEDASVVAPSVAKADCARLQKELFGIVVDGLELWEAKALQKALNQKRFPTEIIDQVELPKLASPKREKTFKTGLNDLSLIDLYGRETKRTWRGLSYAAGGYLLHLVRRRARKMEWVAKVGPRGSTRRRVEMVPHSQLRNQLEFRIELFFETEPYRLQWVLRDKSFLGVNEENLRLRDRAKLNSLLKVLANTLPQSRLNLGIRKAVRDEDFTYPSERAFEEEIVWSFFQLMRQG